MVSFGTFIADLQSASENQKNGRTGVGASAPLTSIKARQLHRRLKQTPNHKAEYRADRKYEDWSKYVKPLPISEVKVSDVYLLIDPESINPAVDGEIFAIVPVKPVLQNLNDYLIAK